MTIKFDEVYERRKQKALESRKRAWDRKQNRIKSKNSWKNLVDRAYNLKPNVIKINHHCTIEHEISKTILAYHLKKEGRDFYSECIFKNNTGRADIFIYNESKVLEILMSETKQKFEQKRTKYPPELEVIPFTTEEVLLNPNGIIVP